MVCLLDANACAHLINGTAPALTARFRRAFWVPFVSLPFDDLGAKQCGPIRAELKRQGRPIGPNDLFIAATAHACDLTLVTHNTREFSQVPGQKLVDWEA